MAKKKVKNVRPLVARMNGRQLREAVLDLIDRVEALEKGKSKPAAKPAAKKPEAKKPE